MIVRHEPARRVYRCDVCGTEGAWGESWSAYSSILLDEICPELVPHICSAPCQAIATAKIERHEWQLPVLSKHPYSPRVKRGPIGYGATT